MAAYSPSGTRTSDQRLTLPRHEVVTLPLVTVNGEGMTDYDERYYQENGQLGFYVRLIRRYLGEGPYLDFGCGTGHLLRRLSAEGPSSGFEISDYSAATARQTAPGCDVMTSMDKLPDRSFQNLSAIHVIEHVDDDIADAVIQAWRRVLVPGGGALVVTPDLGGRAHQLMGSNWDGFSDPTHINLKAHNDWRAFMEARGLSVIAEGSDGLWNPPYGGLPRMLDATLRSGPALSQFLGGRLFLKPGSGESSIFVVRSR